ncbi:putative ribonuclease H-like domain, reverse transcriptase zinc-binding domain-containing protein [Senna tora]|uniref:Putative ribonuclease H-like domain, reverse transcriptase zinc-binding domain-containing protein n=1 Tax=Senna tora TaxID=362788 RepID=A0A834TJD9_9FABA|nr:putative ribonuclease H-like domain, reverse transcriptase zinc-binding domain-containing protein [Senna tora]
MTRSKWRGGWGFKDFHCQNIALLAKQAWRLAHSGDQLWAQIMKSIYFPRCSYWDAKKGRNSSWPWISILEGRDFIRKHCAWSVGNGRSIKVINENWIPGERRIWHVEGGDREMKVCDLLVEGELKWDEQNIATCLPKEVGRKVLALPLNAYTGEDSIVWPFTKDGTYSVSTGYHLLAEEDSGNAMVPSSSNSPDDGLWKVIWGAKVQPKIRAFIWKVCKNALPTKVNLCKRRMTIEDECPLCCREKETIEHLFLNCDWVRAVWFGSPFQWALEGDFSGSFTSWLEERIKLLNNLPKCLQDAIPSLFCLLWSIWRGRNAKVFEGENPDPTLALCRAKNDCKRYIEAVVDDKTDRIPQGVENSRVVKWKPPSKDVLKLNVDAATDIERSKGAIAVVVRDDLGDLLTGLAKRIACLSALQAESLALKEALTFAKALDIRRIIIESDCQQVVSSFNTHSYPWQCASIFKECQALLNGFDHVEVRWINRSANRVADCVAKLSLSHMLPLSWVWSPHVKIRSSLLADKLFCDAFVLGGVQALFCLFLLLPCGYSPFCARLFASRFGI